SHIDHFTPRWGGVSLNDFDASIEKQATAIAPCGHGAIDWTMKSKLSIREQTEATKYQTKNRAQMFNLFPKRLMSLQRAATYVDKSITEISHWKAEVQALPTKCQGVLEPEVNTMNAKYQALSTKIDNSLNDSPPAVNRGLAIGLSLGLGIPLTIAIVFLCSMWIHRRYDFYGLSSERDG
ncbi:uncharacterized protein N7487_009258, partial [Penicillium crustosum]|uniref:uncharacterized protein n=1 Tax=Penicillium crustosum TaxID=36656 RepID=UPI0023996652